VPALTGRFFLLIYESDADSRADFDQMRGRWDHLSERAVELDDKNPTAWLARSIALAFRGRYDAALEANAVAARLDPTNRNILNWRAFFHVFRGEPRAALQAVAEAHAAFPEDNAGALQVACLANLHLGKYEEAIALCEKSSTLEPFNGTHALLAAAYANAGETARATGAREALLRRMPGFTIAMFKARRYSEQPAFLNNVEAHFYSGLRKAGIPEQ
jgi:tetratricopeptide (TPR) repeat protein